MITCAFGDDQVRSRLYSGKSNAVCGEASNAKYIPIDTGPGADYNTLVSSKQPQVTSVRIHDHFWSEHVPIGRSQRSRI